MSFYSTHLWLIILVAWVFLPASQGKSNSVRVCVSGNPLLKATHVVKYCDLLARSKKTHATCVFGTDRLDCLRLVSERKADFTVAEGEDLLFAKAVDLRSILVVSEIRELKKEPYAAKAVVVIRYDQSFLPDLRNARLCHPGWERNSEKSDMFTQFLEERVAPQLCTSNMTLQEDRLLSTAAYFGNTCKAGPWVEDPAEDARLKDVYKILCALCDQPQQCSASDKYWGSGGAATCLKDGAGDALWSTYADVKNYFQLLQSPASNADYLFLCKNGSKQALNVMEPCFWMARPWKVVVANFKAALDVQKTLELLQEENATTDWKENLLNVMEKYLEYIVNLETAKTPSDYLDDIPGFLSAVEMTGGNCQPPHRVTWCTLPGMEARKCRWISSATSAFAIKPDIVCVQRPQLEQCIEAVAAKEADLVVVPPDYIPLAKYVHKLNTMFYESSKSIDGGYSLAAYVKKDSQIHQASDLRSKSACFTQHQGLAWRAALDGLRNVSLVSKACHARGLLHDFFGQVCSASETAGDDVPRCCEVSGRVNDLDAAALSCLTNGGCDVAFLQTMTLPKRTDNNQTSTGWYADDFRRVCLGVQTEDCVWASAPSSALMTSAAPDEVVYKETHHVLSQLSAQFTRRSKKNNMMLSIFGPFQDVSNVIFQDTSSGIVSPARLVNSVGSQIRSLEDILSRTEVCSSSQTIISSISLSIITILLINCL